MFTSDVCWGTLGTSIFGTQVQQQVILDPDYLPDYLSVSYDYGYTYVQIKFLDNFFFQKFSTPTFYNSPFFGFYLHFFKLFVFLPLPSLIAHFGKFLSLPFTKRRWKWQEEIKSYILVKLKVNLLQPDHGVNPSLNLSNLSFKGFPNSLLFLEQKNSLIYEYHL